MRGLERLTQLLEPVVIGMGYDMLGIEYDSHLRILRVYIDQEQGVNVDDCARVSHQLSGVLTVEDPVPGNYQLEVSSPGMDRPLFKWEHFQRAEGALIRFQTIRPLEGRRRFKGRLIAAEGGVIVMTEDGVEYRISFDVVEKARVVPEFEQKNRKGR